MHRALSQTQNVKLLKKKIEKKKKKRKSPDREALSVTIKIQENQPYKKGVCCLTGICLAFKIDGCGLVRVADSQG